MNEPNESCKRIPMPQVLEVAKALASELRLRILEALSEKPMSVTQLTRKLGAAQPTISLNIQMLEYCGLVQTTQHAGRGKICEVVYESLLLELPRIPRSNSMIAEIVMPVGMYTDFRIRPSCGLVGKEGVIGDVDDVQSFYLPDRSDAQLIWFSEYGYIEYRFPNIFDADVPLHALKLSAELCSEARGYNENWPSDITLSINGVEIGTWRSPGDFGEVNGQYTPGWWLGSTQYGLLTEWTVTAESSELNGNPCSAVTLKQLQLTPGEPITVRFIVKPDAEHQGGMNLFGDQFGNTPHAIKLEFIR